MKKTEQQKAEQETRSTETTKPFVSPRSRTKRSLLRRPWVYLVVAIVIGGVAWLAYGWNTDTNGKYETFIVARGELRRTVEVTGEVKPATRIDLSFETGGSVSKINVQTGDVVSSGTVIAELDSKDLVRSYEIARTNLQAAEATLNQALAGERNESIDIAKARVAESEANVQRAKVEYDQANQSGTDAIRSAELALQTSENLLENKRNQLSADVRNAYADLRVQLISAIGAIESATIDGDAIIGVDDKVTNLDYLYFISAKNTEYLARAKQSYALLKTKTAIASTDVQSLTVSSPENQIVNAAKSVEAALIQTQLYVADVQSVLGATITGSRLTQAELDAKSAVINGHRASISTQTTQIVGLQQMVGNAELSSVETIQSLEDAVRARRLDVEISRTNAAAKLASSKSALDVAYASLESARADLALRSATPRDVDVNPLRSRVSESRIALEQAQANLSKIQIIAPVDGTVSEILPEIGENVTPNATVIRMIAVDVYDIEALIPEADIALVRIGQPTTITLDAYGDDLTFNGSILTVDPDQTVVQDAVYYETVISIDPSGNELKPGMTTNITILTAKNENVLTIPTRAIRTDAETGERIVRVLNDRGVESERSISVGLRGDEGRIVVENGLNEGETIIVSERK